MFSFFNSKPLLDANTTEWIFDSYEWALTQFDADIFFQKTQLVLPTNDFFPGKVASVAEMSAAIFQRIKTYAQVEQWPIALVQPEIYNPPQTLLLTEQVSSRSTQLTQVQAAPLPVSFHPAQINKPQDLIANLTVQMTNYVANNIDRRPPGGQEFWPQAVELLSVYFGFGIMLSNSAYTFRGGCGSCYNKSANREAALPESEAVFALAIFCRLKDIPASQVSGHLKSYLRKDFKHALKDIKKNHGERISFLKELKPDLAS